MTWNPSMPEVPIDVDGNWLSFPNYNKAGWELIPRPFYAELEVDSMRTGRSSKVVVLKDTNTGKVYPMFVADLVKGIQRGTLDVDSGRLLGWWTVSKRGQNYGICAVPTEEV